MKKILSIILVASMLMFALAACGDGGDTSTPAPTQAPEATPAPTPPPEDDTPAAVSVPDTFPWDDFTDRDPQNKPELAPNGQNIWWDNWANMRANVEGGVATIQFQPKAFDPLDYDNYADYAARGGDWMGNWGEAINMWALEGISYCKYLVIRMAGADGGEEGKLLLHFEPEDRAPYIVPFVNLVTKDGGAPAITTDMQDIYIDLEASGLPGMTNRMHIRAFGECTVMLDEIYFAEPVAPIDATDGDTIFAGFTVQPTGGLGDLPPSTIGVALWDDFTDRDPDNKPELAPNGQNIWWDNWANMRASVTDGVAEIDFRPKEFDSQDYDDMDDYYARAADWMGNWGEAINMWALPGISYSKYMVILIGGAEGGEENKLVLHFQPEDGPLFAARFSDLVTARGGSPEITTDIQAIVIDLEASGFAGMTNRMHIRAFAPCTIMLDEIFFCGAVAPIDTSEGGDVLAGITATPLGSFADLPIADFIAELS